ncbi:MAG: hypothetical protein GYA55_02380 [SAR324 cluster bacterium]|uniref:Uncharacterized protein n=1 Tax=SAR324 cluster bacterium TaxID=2024889 RepID=A0A7X9IKI0_9DELT|nr:hypothetical protein [SAR324 cluster bacterium]
MKMPDRLVVQEVLLGRRRSKSEAESAPIIKKIETEEIPVLKLAGLPCAAAILLILMSTLCVLCLKAAFGIDIPEGILFLGFGGITVGSLVLSHSRKRALKKQLKKMKKAVVELVDLLEFVKASVAQCEERIAKQPSCDKLSDSFALYILTQIRDLIKRRLKKISILLAEPDRNNLTRAQILFARPIAIRDSKMEGVGRSYPVEISKIRDVVGPLVEFIEEGILAIETENAERNAELDLEARASQAA